MEQLRNNPELQNRLRGEFMRRFSGGGDGRSQMMFRRGSGGGDRGRRGGR
jgi:hypothetical protein